MLPMHGGLSFNLYIVEQLSTSRELRHDSPINHQIGCVLWVPF